MSSSSPFSRAAVRRALRATEGASLVEYIVALGCVALLAIVGFQKFGVALYSKSRTFGDNVTNLTPVQGGSSYCFVAGTLVATPDGERPIEQIREGDRVLTRDERSGELTARRAIATSVTPDAPLVEVRIREQAEAIRATPGHRFLTADRGWIEAQHLAPGEALRSTGDGDLHVDAVRALDARATVYNFEVEETHAYFVGSARAWVHNGLGDSTDCNGAPITAPTVASNDCPDGQCTCFAAGTKVATMGGLRAIEEIRAGDYVLSKSEDTGETDFEPVTATYVTEDAEVVGVYVSSQTAPIVATPAHPFFTRDRGWLAAKELESGEALVSPDGSDVAVVAVESRAARVTVYNLAVAELHTYFVGAGVWVHNVCNFNQPHDTTIQTLTTNNTNKPVVIPPQTMVSFIQNSNNIDDQYKPGLIAQANGGKPIIVQPAGANPPVITQGSNQLKPPQQQLINDIQNAQNLTQQGTPFVQYPNRPSSGNSGWSQLFEGKHLQPGSQAEQQAEGRFNGPGNITTSTNIPPKEQNKLNNEVADNNANGTYAAGYQAAQDACGGRPVPIDHVTFQSNQSYNTQTYRRQGQHRPFGVTTDPPQNSPIFYSVTQDPKNGRYIINHFSGTTQTENGQYQPPPGQGWQHANVNGTNVYFHCG